MGMCVSSDTGTIGHVLVSAVEENCIDPPVRRVRGYAASNKIKSRYQEAPSPPCPFPMHPSSRLQGRARFGTCRVVTFVIRQFPWAGPKRHSASVRLADSISQRPDPDRVRHLTNQGAATKTFLRDVPTYPSCAGSPGLRGEKNRRADGNKQQLSSHLPPISTSSYP